MATKNGNNVLITCRKDQGTAELNVDPQITTEDDQIAMDEKIRMTKDQAIEKETEMVY